MRRIFVIILVLGLLLAAGGIGGRKVYREWKGGKAVAQAREAWARADYSKAGLWLRRALEADSKNVEALRMMGELAEVLQLSDAAIFWRSRLLEAEPLATNRLILARAALAGGSHPVARQALEGLDPASQQRPEYHKLAAALALAMGRYDEAEAHFREAQRLEPNNLSSQLNLAALLMQRSEGRFADQGRAMLESLRANSGVRLEALRHLTRDALQRTNSARAVALAAEVVGDTNSAFADQFLYLDAMVLSRSPRLSSALAGTQQLAGTNAVQVFSLARWMLGAMPPVDTLRWLQTLPPGLRTNLPVAMTLADAYLELKDWVGLRQHVGTQRWDEMEYLRLAYASRALRQQSLDAAAKVEWSKAVRATEGSLDRLSVLQRVVGAWRWFPELEELLWMVVNKYPSEKPALQSLSNLLFASGKTRSLLSLYAQEARREPGNLIVKNNLAEIALLLDTPEHNPHELARYVYENEKTNATFAATFAFSLHLQNKTSEGLRILNQFRPEELEKPTVAGFYGVLLAASGDRAQAARYVELSVQNPLLPEEKTLFLRSRL